MNQEDLDEFLENGLTVIHLKLMYYLRDKESAYMYDVTNENPKIFRRFIELAVLQKPHIYEKIELPPVIVHGGSRSRTSGIRLTKYGQNLAAKI